MPRAEFPHTAAEYAQQAERLLEFAASTAEATLAAGPDATHNADELVARAQVLATLSNAAAVDELTRANRRLTVDVCR